jgi:hypothetical protein
MDIPGLSDDSLLALHRCVAEALAADDASPAASGDKPYGVRQHSDWRKQADGYEAELRARRLAFTPIA